MNILYEVIFGETWGGGHLARALKLKENSSDCVDIYINFEKPGDELAIPFHGAIFPSAIKTKYDLHVIDTLGKFALNIASAEKIFLDAIELHNEDHLTHEHYLYPCRVSTEFRFSSLMKSSTSKNIAIIQGSSDDHNQIISISKKVPKNYHQVIFTTTNCRHLEALQEFTRKNANIDLLVNAKFTQYLKMFSTVITAGGNTFLETLESDEKFGVIIYSREEKEHMTIQNHLKHKKIVKYFRLEDEFEWDCTLDY